MEANFKLKGSQFWNHALLWGGRQFRNHLKKIFRGRKTLNHFKTKSKGNDYFKNTYVVCTLYSIYLKICLRNTLSEKKQLYTA
jgi:hypothetical protein